jgi:hypothetical protein
MTEPMLKTGKRPAQYHPELTRLVDIKTSIGLATPIYKSSFGYGNDFHNGPTGWKILGNGPPDDNSIPQADAAALQGAGDCAWAGSAHETMLLCKNARRPVPKFTGLNILQQYSAYSGYDLVTGANDNGSDVVEVLKWRQTKGLVDASGGIHKIGVFVSLEVGNLTELWEALYYFDTVGLGINFPESAMTQLNQGQIWSVVSGAQIEGGHYIPLVGRPTANTWTCITWGQRQIMTEQFVTTYMDEAYCYITLERYNAVTGETPQGVKDYDLEKYLYSLPKQ